MNKSVKHSKVSLAARREALVTECALQRITAARDVREIMAPVHNAARTRSAAISRYRCRLLGWSAGLIATRSGS